MVKMDLRILYPVPHQAERYLRVLLPEATSNGLGAKEKTAKKAKEKPWTS